MSMQKLDRTITYLNAGNAGPKYSDLRVCGFNTSNGLLTLFLNSPSFSFDVELNVDQVRHLRDVLNEVLGEKSPTSQKETLIIEEKT